MPSVITGYNAYIKPHYIVVCPEWSSASNLPSVRFLENQKNLANNQHSGLLSKKSVSKLRSAINWLVCSAKPKSVFSEHLQKWFTFKINFITLTIPYCHKKPSNRELKEKLLNPFLTLMRSKYGLNNYVWKVEFQANGMPHVHFTTDSFIHWRVIKRCWNKLLLDNGYMADYTNKFWGCDFDKYLSLIPAKSAVDRAKAKKAFEAGQASGWRQPNSTDVHSVKSVKDIAAYISKYMAKNSQLSEKFTGRIWGCSFEISRALSTSVFVDPSQASEVLKPLFSNQIEFMPILGKPDAFGRQNTIAEMFKLKYSDWKNKISGALREKFEFTCQSLAGLVSNSPSFYTV